MAPLIEQSLKARPSASSEARKLLTAIAGELPAETYEDVRLLVSELVTNSIRHSGLERARGATVGFVVRLEDRCLRVEVTDQGRGFAKNVTPSTPDQTSGWGLQIVERLTHRWGVDRHQGQGSTVWFEIDL
jgi:anti-sigma regulatory factor (Ser/Thr protein kinase)